MHVQCHMFGQACRESDHVATCSEHVCCPGCSCLLGGLLKERRPTRLPVPENIEAPSQLTKICLPEALRYRRDLPVPVAEEDEA